MDPSEADSARLFFAWPILALVLYGSATAQQTPVIFLDEIVVTATRTETTVRDAARSVSVVDQEHIQNGTQQLGLDESLAGIPGLYMQNRYNFAQDLRVSLRGFGARSDFGIRGIKVIVDGIPETLPDGQAGVDSIDLGSARRIEVLRGPSSSLYGNASGGVIAVETEYGQDPSFVETNVAAGELGYAKYQLKAGGRAALLEYLINVSSQEFEGHRDHSESKGIQVNGRFGIRLNDGDLLTLALNHTDQPTAQDPGGINAAQAATDPGSARDRNVLFDVGEALDQQRVGIVYERHRTSGSLTLRNHYVWRHFSNQLPFEAGGAGDLRRFFGGVGAQYTFGDVLPEQLELTAGLDVDRQDDDRKRLDNLQGVIGPLVFDQREKVDSKGVFVQSHCRFRDRWGLSAGLRYDEISFHVSDRYLVDGDDSGNVDFDQVSPSLGLSVDFGNAMLFGTTSSSFETPTTTELANPDGSGGFNRALKPQRATNYEVGVKARKSKLYCELAVFHIDLEDELVPFDLARFPGRTFFANAGRSSRTGVETAVSWTSPTGLGVNASYTWSDFRFDDYLDDNGNDFSRLRAPGLPARFAYLGFRYRTGGFDSTFETTFSGDLFADNANSVSVSSYAVSGVRASYEFQRGNRAYRPYVGVNNLFNERYNGNIRINAVGGNYFEPAPGRNAYAGVVIRHEKDSD